MPTPRKLRLIVTLVAWLLGAVLALSAVGVFAYGLFVLLSVLGLVIVTDLYTLSSVRPRWYGRLRPLVTAGLVVVIITVGLRLVQLFAPDLLP